MNEPEKTKGWLTRPICWEDVHFSVREMFSHIEHLPGGENKCVNKPVMTTKGEVCYQIVLKLCSFVRYECWMKPEPNNELKPETKAYMLLKLQAKLRKVVNALKTYERN